MHTLQRAWPVPSFMRNNPTSGGLIERLALLSLAAALQCAGISVLQHSVRGLPPQLPAAPERLVSIFIQPQIVDSANLTKEPDLAQVTVRLDDLLGAPQIEAPDISFSVTRNAAALVATPTLRSNGRLSLERHANTPGLGPGSGATIVLRIEVLATGEPGRIVVDVSSGNSQVDQLAISLAHVQHWYAGRISGVPRSMWIRWAVHLQS